MLSSRASDFIRRCKRRLAVRDREGIVAAIEAGHCPVFEPVVAFQELYGGLVEQVYFEPMVFGIMHPKPRRFERPNTVYAEERDGLWYFECCDTLYQMQFELDQYGRYYEDWFLIASSFEKFIEGKAFLDAVPIIGEPQHQAFDVRDPRDVNEVLDTHGFQLVPDPSDDYTTWWCQGNVCIAVRQDYLEAWYQNSEGKELIDRMINIISLQAFVL